MTSAEQLYFYKFIVNSQVFYKSKYSFALVNLKPLVPGHVLIVPIRTNILKFSDLNNEESIDYMNTLQIINKFIQFIYKADAMNIAIQDGPESGQSIPHLHTHLIPRFKVDGLGDSIHSKLESNDLLQPYKDFFERKNNFIKNGSDFKPIADYLRKPRTPEIMEKEANWLSEELNKFIKDIN